MTYLGTFTLWAALLFGCWTAAVAFFADWRRRPVLAVAITRGVYATCAALLVATAALWRGSSRTIFNIEYVWA